MFCGATLSTKPSSRQQGSDPDVTRASFLAGQVQRKSPESRPLAHVPRSPLPPAAPRFLSKQTLGGGDCQGRAQRLRNPATSPKHRPRSGPAGLHRGSAPLSGIGDSGDGITGCPERLAPSAPSLARTQRVVITAPGDLAQPGHHRHCGPTSDPDSGGANAPTLEPSRCPEERQSPQIPRPLPWDGYAPPDPAQTVEEGWVAGVAGLVSPLTHIYGETHQPSTLEPSPSAPRGI